MSAPTVACVLLANGRPEMVKRAVASFRAQTYEHKRLIIWDTTPNGPISEMSSYRPQNERLVEDACGFSIGMLHNRASEWIRYDIDSDIICHWDSDDWSHPNRIAEQVALLQSSGAECVGYNEMLFWEEQWYRPCGDKTPRKAEAWLYRSEIKNYAIGTSMCYWQSTWERAPFPDYSAGCDDLYWSHGDSKKGIPAVKIESVDSLTWHFAGYPQVPRMIASIHGGNTCAKIDAKGKEWTRVPEWDEYCREAMKL